MYFKCNYAIEVNVTDLDIMGSDRFIFINSKNFSLIRNHYIFISNDIKKSMWSSIQAHVVKFK